MARQQHQNKAYYTLYKKLLQKKLDDVISAIEPETVGNLFINPSPEATLLKSMHQGVTKHPLRYYQKEALYTLHHIYPKSIDVCRNSTDAQSILLKTMEYKHIKPLLEKVDSETERKAPFLGFEMATGSGKTMLMGASIYYLNKNFNIQNFLIITPSSTDIYKKTIRNFYIGTKETVWHDDVNFKFNLINGDNFKDTKDLLHSETDANIFIFNIDKFGSNATNTKKNWESSIWNDGNGNSISLLDYLSTNDLVIITDEAHHAQSPKANKVITTFKPLAVLEYTATAIETGRNEQRKNQTIVYKYDIKRFLEDKYGKLVRVLALPGNIKNKPGRTTEISTVEKYKLQLFFLVHLLKKKALTLDTINRSLKAIGFVKVKNEIKYAEKVEKYIKEQLAEDTTSLEIILEKAKTEDTETTNLILQLFENEYDSDIELLQKEINKIAQTSILYTSKSDKIIIKQYDDILRNQVEIVIFIDKLNEGIDMPNIYSMVVINDNPTDFRTSVKQIIGRGVRLNREQRQYDDEIGNLLLTHNEKLHIICDKGAAFQEVILQIQKEFGLNDKTFAIESGEEQIITNRVKRDKLKGIQIPRIKIDFKRKQDASIQNVIENYSKIIQDYIESNCFNRTVDGQELKFLKYTPDSFFTEIDLFIDEKEFHRIGEQQGWNFTLLEITEKNMKDIYGRVISKLKPIPDIPKTYSIFQQYGLLLNKAEIYYYNLDFVDYKIAIQRLIDSFTYFYIHYVENIYFELDLDTIDAETNTWLLVNQFLDETIKVRKKEIKNKSRNIDDNSALIEKIKNGYFFYGYENSIYEYDKFDTLPEKQLADYVNHLIENNPNKENPFWVRNDRNIFFEYGSHKYYPDFILFFNKIIYVIEIKAEVFSNPKKNRLLIELNNVKGRGNVKQYKGVVVFQVQMNKLKDLNKDFNEFIKEAETYFEQIQSKTELVPDSEVDPALRYIEFVPAFESHQAFDHFVNKKHLKNVKWLKVPRYNYKDSVFASLIKDNSLGMELSNKWVLFTSNVPDDPSVFKDSFVLCYHPSIEESYYKHHTTIKKFSFEETLTKDGLFEHKNIKIILSSVDNDAEPLTIDSNKDFKVIAVKYN